MRWQRRQDDRLLILLAGAATAPLIEGFACYLIRCWHSPVGMVEVYESFGVHVPLWLALVYVVFFGSIVYLFLARFTRAPSALFFWGFFAAVGVLEGGFEVMGIHWGMFVYHGPQPVAPGGFPLHLGFVNPTLAVVYAAVAQAWLARTRGAARWLLVVGTAPLMTGLYAALVMPLAAGLHTEDLALAQIGSIASIVLALLAAQLAYTTLKNGRA